MPPKNRITTAELINAVRRCALAGMSFSTAAAELTTPARAFTSGAIAGIAHRNGIKFNSNRKRGHAVRAQNPHHAPRKPPATVTRPSFVTTNVRVSTTAPGVACSWAGCMSDAELGDMFCFSHGKRGLFGAP